MTGKLIVRVNQVLSSQVLLILFLKVANLGPVIDELVYFQVMWSKSQTAKCYCLQVSGGQRSKLSSGLNDYQNC